MPDCNDAYPADPEKKDICGCGDPEDDGDQSKNLVFEAAVSLT